MIGELSAKIAHEIKNPLAGIYAAVQLLCARLPAGRPAAGDLRRRRRRDPAARRHRPGPAALRAAAARRSRAPTGLRNFVLRPARAAAPPARGPASRAQGRGARGADGRHRPAADGPGADQPGAQRRRRPWTAGTIADRAPLPGRATSRSRSIDTGPGVPAAQRRRGLRAVLHDQDARHRAWACRSRARTSRPTGGTLERSRARARARTSASLFHSCATYRRRSRAAPSS